MNIKSFLYLCQNIPLDPNYEYTLDFDNLTAQDNYFDSKISNTLSETDDYSYIRKDEEIKVYANVDDLFGVNYLYFINDTKRYYAFITEKRYISETCTAIKFKIDVMQTFMFDYTLKESFIDREHQDRWQKINNVYTPIFNTKVENVDYGNEYKTNTSELKTLTAGSHELVFVYIFANKKLEDGGDDPQVRYVDEYLPNGNYLYMTICVDKEADEAEEVIKWQSGLTEKELATLNYIKELASNSYIDQIVISKIPPVEMKVSSSETEGYVVEPNDWNSIDAYIVDLTPNDISETNLLKVYSRKDKAKAFTKIKEFSTTYTPSISHNNLKNIALETKLLTHPYNFKKVYFGTNELDLRNEYLNNASVSVYQSLCGEATTLLKIDNYLNTGSINNMKTITNNIPYNIDMVTNAWKEYMLANKAQRKAGFINTAVNIGASVVGAIATGGVSLATGAMGVINTGLQIGTQLAKEHDIKNKPNDVKQFGDDIGINLVSCNLLAKLIEYELTDEYKKQVYDYLYHYGYKASEFKSPNLRSRYYFNYIKTIGANIDSNIDNDYIVELKRIFDNGITIWHYRQDFKGVNNFDYENAEMTMEV